MERGALSVERGEGNNIGYKGNKAEAETSVSGNSNSASELKNAEDFLEELSDRLARGEITELVYLKTKPDSETTQVLE